MPPEKTVRQKRPPMRKTFPTLYVMQSEKFHADLIDVDERLMSVYGAFGFGDYVEHLKVLIGDANYASWTIIDEEANIIGLTGAFMMIQGVARVWYCPASIVFKDRRVRAMFFKTLKRCLDSIIEQWGLRRVECIIREDFEEAFVVPFNRKFRFSVEGMMRHYDTNGGNYYLLAKYCNEGDDAVEVDE
jgi:hypothetical protein